MTAITFDTLAYSKKLKKAGVPEKQAEAQAEITVEIMKDIFDTQVATKQDFLALKAANKQELHGLHVSIQRDLANLTIRMGIMIAGGVTLVPLVLKIASLL